MRAKEFIPPSKPRNFVAKHQQTSGSGAHVDRKRAEKQGYEKHKGRIAQESLYPGEYYLWTVHFADGEVKEVPVTWDETSKKDLENRFKKEITKIDHDFKIHSRSMPAAPKQDGRPADYSELGRQLG